MSSDQRFIQTMYLKSQVRLEAALFLLITVTTPVDFHTEYNASKSGTLVWVSCSRTLGDRMTV